MNETLDQWLAAIRDNPHDESLRMVFSDWLEEGGKASGDILFAFRSGRIFLFGPDQTALAHLRGCRMPPGSFPKGFVRDLGNVVSPKQYALLWEFVWHYRRQLPKSLVLLAPKKYGKEPLLTRKAAKVKPALAFADWADANLKNVLPQNRGG